MGARAELVWKGKQRLLQDMCGITGKVEFLKGWSGGELHLYSETIPIGPEGKLSVGFRDCTCPVIAEGNGPVATLPPTSRTCMHLGKWLQAGPFATDFPVSKTRQHCPSAPGLNFSNVTVLMMNLYQ